LQLGNFGHEINFAIFCRMTHVRFLLPPMILPFSLVCHRAILCPLPIRRHRPLAMTRTWPTIGAQRTNETLLRTNLAETTWPGGLYKVGSNSFPATKAIFRWTSTILATCRPYFASRKWSCESSLSRYSNTAFLSQSVHCLEAFNRCDFLLSTYSMAHS
jgi:hypothetical protein